MVTWCTNIYIYIYTHTHTHIYIYIYIYLAPYNESGDGGLADQVKGRSLLCMGSIGLWSADSITSVKRVGMGGSRIFSWSFTNNSGPWHPRRGCLLLQGYNSVDAVRLCLVAPSAGRVHRGAVTCSLLFIHLVTSTERRRATSKLAAEGADWRLQRQFNFNLFLVREATNARRPSVWRQLLAHSGHHPWSRSRTAHAA
jgi:hypothetical protein